MHLWNINLLFTFDIWPWFRDLNQPLFWNIFILQLFCLQARFSVCFGFVALFKLHFGRKWKKLLNCLLIILHWSPASASAVRYMETRGRLPNVRGTKNHNDIKPNLLRSFCDQTESPFFASLITRVAIAAIVDPGVHTPVECCLCRSMTTGDLPGAPQQIRLP